MKRKLKAGTTSVTVELFIPDTSSAVGAGLSGVLFNTAGLTCKYLRQGAAVAVSVTLVTMTLGTWASGGFIACGTVGGRYQLGIPDAALAAGARYVVLDLYGAANMPPLSLEIELDAVDYQDAVGFGLSRLNTDVATLLEGQALVHRAALQSGSADRVTLALTASAEPQAYRGAALYVVSGPGAGNWRTITDYNNISKLALVEPDFAGTAPGGPLAAGGPSVVAIYADSRPAVNSSNQVQTADSGGITSLLARLGAFSGTGANTVLGVLQALARIDLSAPTNLGGTYDPATDSLEAIRNRGDAAWGGNLGPGGFAFTPLLEDEDSAPVAGVLVTIQNADGDQANPPWGITDTNGQIVSFALAAGDYQVLVNAGPRYETLPPQDLTITGTGPQTATYTLIGQGEAPPTIPGLCVVGIDVIHPVGGLPVDGVVVTAELTAGNNAVDPALLTRQVGRAVTGAGSWPPGHAELQLIRQDQFTKGRETYQIRATQGTTRFFDLITAIPNADSCLLSELLPE